MLVQEGFLEQIKHTVKGCRFDVSAALAGRDSNYASLIGAPRRGNKAHIQKEVAGWLLKSL